MKSVPSLRTALAIGLLVVVSVGCGGDDTATDTDTIAPDPTVAETTQPDDPAPDPTGDALIVISGFSFGEPLSVAPGTTVTVRNDDEAAHTWTSTDGLFDSGSLRGDATFSHTFDQPGTFDFVCSFHPGMTGTITVG